MAVIFDYTESYSLDADGHLESAPGTDVVLWMDLFNPGHTGTNIALLVRSTTDFQIDFNTSASSVCSWKFQYREIGGSWTDIVTGGATYGTDTTANILADEFIETDIDAPLQLRVIASMDAAGSSFRIKAGDAFLIIRMIGTVA